MKENTPIRSGEQLQVAVEGNVLRVTNDPGYTNDNPEGVPRRAIALYRQTTNGYSLVGGRELPLPPAIAKTLPDERWPGYFDTREELAAARWTLTTGSYLLRVYGGSLFPGWGDHPLSEIEWGIVDVNGYLNEARFSVASTPPPPPPVPTVKETLAENEAAAAGVLYRLVEQWRLAGRNDAEIADTLHYQLIKVLQTSGPVRQQLKSAIRNLLG